MARRKPKGMTTEALAAYSSRKRALAAMGFQRYEDGYLLSDLWKEIRAWVLRRDGNRCYGCGEFGRQVHHEDYSERVLRGEMDARHLLHTICKKCHEACEYFLGAKVGPREATELLRRRRKGNGL